MKIPWYGLHRQHVAVWVKLHTKSTKHYFWKLKKSLGNLQSKPWISPLQKMAKMYRDSLGVQLNKIEKTQAFLMAPWASPLTVVVREQEEAIRKARSSGEAAMFADASMRNGFIGVGVCKLVGEGGGAVGRVASFTLATYDRCNIYTGELVAVQYALQHIINSLPPEHNPPQSMPGPKPSMPRSASSTSAQVPSPAIPCHPILAHTTIYTDSCEVLESLCNPEH